MAYALRNTSVALAFSHLKLLASILDEFTLDRIIHLRSDLRGAHCLEVGAGAGSVGNWLAEQVGPKGMVIATDTDPQHIPPHPRMWIRRHDLTGSDPLPKPESPLGFDLIHARLVLCHLPERVKILHNLAQALAPGGILLVEDWETTNTNLVLRAPHPPFATLYDAVQDALGRVFEDSGTDRRWARRVPAAMATEGLVRIGMEERHRSWPGGSAFPTLVAGTLVQLRIRLLASGITSDQIELTRGILSHPDLILQGHPMYSTAGFRPLIAP